ASGRWCRPSGLPVRWRPGVPRSLSAAESASRVAGRLRHRQLPEPPPYRLAVFRRPAQVEVQKDQRDEDGPGTRSDEGEDFAGAGNFNQFGEVGPALNPEDSRQKCIEPLLVDQASDQLRYHLSALLKGQAVQDLVECD